MHLFCVVVVMRKLFAILDGIFDFAEVAEGDFFYRDTFSEGLYFGWQGS